MRIILIRSALSSVQIELSHIRQNLSFPGLEIVRNANSGFGFQGTSSHSANQRFALIIMLLDLSFFESQK